MRIIIGKPGSGKTHRLVAEFVSQEKHSVLLVPNTSQRELIINAYFKVLAFHEVALERIVTPEGLKNALQKFKPKYIYLDNLKSVLSRVLDIKQGNLEAFTLDMDLNCCIETLPEEYHGN